MRPYLPQQHNPEAEGAHPRGMQQSLCAVGGSPPVDNHNKVVRLSIANVCAVGGAHGNKISIKQHSHF